ncbi:MAG: hypothetical protein EGR48_09335 [Lachnospiraceae bacterium]|nr:hypothetical protein [Lachnospiraceae bacterium]
MAGTTIRGVENSGNVQMPDMATAAKQNAGTGFQAVWNKTQSSAQTANASTNNRNRTDHSDVRRGDSLKNGDRQRDNLVHASDDKGMDIEKTDAKDLEKAQEVLGTIVQNLIGQITGTFSISEEELQGIMDDLGMTKMDLTDPASLNELLMNISGAQDSFALLTDENLYGNVKGIMNLQNELVGQAQEDLKLAPEEWQQTVAGIAQKTVAEPVITVEMDDTVNTAAGSQTGEAAIPMQEPEILENQAAQNTQGEKAGDFGEKQEHAANGEHGNLLLQNLKEGNFLTQLQQTAQTEEAGPVDTQDIMRQIMDYMKVSVKPDSSDLEMQLHPQSLGTLHIQMAAKNGVVTANFITENETVKAALESQMVQLKENFTEQGIKVEAIEVTVQTHQFEQNLEQGRDGSGSREAEAGVGKRRTRRINLNTAFAEDEPQTEEDRIAADMMSANGNTVDFTA